MNHLPAIDTCLSCREEMPKGECPESKLSCGHHCDCSWTGDVCHWCGAQFGDVDDPEYGVPQKAKDRVRQLAIDVDYLGRRAEEIASQAGTEADALLSIAGELRHLAGEAKALATPNRRAKPRKERETEPTAPEDRAT